MASEVTEMSRNHKAILVTGATGYVGGRLVAHLADKGLLVRGSTRGTRQPSGWRKDVNLVKLDLQDDDLLQANLVGVDTIVHLAAANEIRSMEDPDAALDETAGGTRRLLEAAIRAEVRRFLFMSTIHVYGSSLSGTVSERTLTRPIHPYSIGHLAAEHYVHAAQSSGRIEGISIRLSNAVGAPAWPEVDRWSLVGNDFVRQAILTSEIFVNTPKIWRDFVPLSDVMDGVTLLLDAPKECLHDGVFNLGGGVSLEIGDLATLCATTALKSMGRKVEIHSPHDSTHSNKLYEISIERMKDLGFQPSGLDGLEREIEASLHLVAKSIIKQG